MSYSAVSRDLSLKFYVSVMPEGVKHEKVAVLYCYPVMRALQEDAGAKYVALVSSLLKEDATANATPSATVEGLKPVSGIEVS